MGNRNEVAPLRTPGVLLSCFRRDIALVGGGKMGLALLANWIDAGLAPQRVQVVDPHPSEAMQNFSALHGIALVKVPSALASAVIVLAVKPQNVGSVVGSFSGRIGNDCDLVSIMVGVRITQLREMFPAAALIVRAMPNLAAAVGCGATLLVSDTSLDRSAENGAERLFAASGLVERLDDECLLDAGTALSGSGPGYLFFLVECLAEAAHRAGLPRATALRLARRTVEGAGALLSASQKGPGELRAEVTSPGGTTQAGIAVLASDDRLTNLLTETLEAATARSRELGALPKTREPIAGDHA